MKHYGVAVIRLAAPSMPRPEYLSRSGKERRGCVVTDVEMDAFFNIVQAAEELIDAYEDAFRKVERSAAGRDDLVVWVSAFQFQWLQAKFEHCWDKRAAVEAALLQFRPKSVVFGPTDFERLIQAILGLVEGRRFQETSASHDEGVDLVDCQRIAVDYEAWATTIVQCKLYRGFVPVTDLRDFFGVMVARTATGLFFTTGDITPQGKRFLPQANASSMANRFHLIAPPDFDRLLKICERLAEMTMDDDGISEAEFRTEAGALRKSARAMIYAKWTAATPAQGSLW
jgi:hypothetical protein